MNQTLTVVDQFKYLGHILTDNLSDDLDIRREIKALFTRCNILINSFKLCSYNVKLVLFKTYCCCFFGTALWAKRTVNMYNQFVSCYLKYIKCFFGYRA